VWVQRNAMRALAGEGDFASLVGADADIAGHLGAELVAQVFDPAAHLKHVDYIFRRVFEAPDPAP
jgi:adenylosuccinate lyase